MAAENKTWSSASSESHEGRLGVYAGGQVEAGAAGGVLGGDVTRTAEASAGIKGSYTYDRSRDESSDSRAAVSRYRAGGNITSTTTGETTLTGTQFEAGKDVSISASRLDYQAAKDVATTSSQTIAGGVEAKAKLTGTVGGELKGSFERSDASSSATTAKAGSVAAGGNVTLHTGGDVRLEGTKVTAGDAGLKGTNVTSGGKATIQSDSGSVRLEAAKNTTTESASGYNVGASVSVSKHPAPASKGSKPSAAKPAAPGKSVAKPAAQGKTVAKGVLSGGYSSESANSTTSEGAVIRGKEVEVSAKQDVVMEGARVSASDKATVSAGRNVKLLESKDTRDSSSLGLGGNLAVSKKSKPDGSSKNTQMGGIDVRIGSTDKQTGSATSIQSGGDVTVKGAAITSQKAELSGYGKVTKEGPVTELGLTKVDKGMKVDVDVDVVHSKETKGKAADKAGPAPAKKTKSADSGKRKPVPAVKSKPPESQAVSSGGAKPSLPRE